MSANARRIRPAAASDHAAFERLFPELEVDDPPTPLEKFIRDVMPTMLVAEAGEGTPGPDRAVGYTHFQVIADLLYVRHIVTAPDSRRTGVGRALLTAVASRARAAGCSGWCLNVKRENTAAIALYEALGMARAFDSKALHLDWANADAASRNVHNTRVLARPIEAEDDRRVETAMGLVTGQLATSRGRSERVLVGLFEGETVAGVAVFDAAFPSAYPFRASCPEHAFLLLRAVRSHAPSDAHIRVVSEGQPAIAEALIAAGASVVHDIVHMKGALSATDLTASR
jgi:ribosomal protein S18 acetylase RimI-like enzyme